MESDFKVKIGDFEGPLELLLDLIEKRKLHINSVSLSEVADEFIEHTKSFEDFPIADSADFILIASTLLLIKSKSLLPNLELSEEEKGNIEDLEKRLELYKIYKDSAKALQSIFGNFMYFAKDRPIRYRTVVFSPTKEVSVDSLQNALRSMLAAAPKIEKLPQVNVSKIITLEEMIEKLTEKIENSLRMSFSSFSGREGTGEKVMSKEDRINVIVSFLAMLELVKRGAVRVIQEGNLSEIEIESENINTPTYV